jgi:hypothetical protein
MMVRVRISGYFSGHSRGVGRLLSFPAFPGNRRPILRFIVVGLLFQCMAIGVGSIAIVGIRFFTPFFPSL